MPEFILGGMTEPSFQQLNSFAQGYVQAMFFTSCEAGSAHDASDDLERVWNPETDSSLPGDVGFADLAPDALQKAIEACNHFQAENARALEAAYKTADYNEERAGMDFWYTRCGHGCGYWDRDLGATGELLSEAARKTGNVDAYMGDDGKVYLS